MSMLSSQADELREAARNIQGKLGRCLYRRKDVDEMQQVSGMLFEAADTIIRLRNRLQEIQGVTGESRYSKLFGTPERAARTMAGKCGDCFECVLENDCEYGCDEGCLLSDRSNYNALLEWLRGDAE